MMEETASVGPLSDSPGTGVAQDHTRLVTYLIEVDHDIALRASAALDILQGQGEVDTPGVWDVEVVGVVLIPFLDRCKHLILICADDVHVLNKTQEVKKKNFINESDMHPNSVESNEEYQNRHFGNYKER